MRPAQGSDRPYWGKHVHPAFCTSPDGRENRFIPAWFPYRRHCGIYDGPDEQVGKDVAMHIAAMKPAALSAEQVDPALIERERSIAQQKAEGDSAKARSRKARRLSQPISSPVVSKVPFSEIPEGSFPGRISLLLENDKQSVGQKMLKEKNTTIKSLYVGYWLSVKVWRKNRTTLPRKLPRKWRQPKLDAFKDGPKGPFL